MKFRLITAAILVLLMTVGGTTIPSGRVSADIDGDNLDEVGAFAVEVAGSARGPWFQIYDGTGATVLDTFMLNGWTGQKMKTIDINGDGADELVVLATRISDGKVVLRAYDATGTMLASVRLAPDSSVFTGFDFFPINYNGGVSVEIAVVKERISTSKGQYEVWSLAGSNLVMQAAGSGTVTETTGHQWVAADVDGDGNEELACLSTRNSDGVRRLHVLDPQSQTIVKKMTISGDTFSGHQMVAGNFMNGGISGQEIAVSYVEDATGKIKFKLKDETGTSLKWGQVQGAGSTQHTLLAVDATSGIDHLFFGMVRSNGTGLYKVMDITGAVTQVTARLVTNDTVQVVDWLVGNFDTGTAGDEVVVGYVRISDGRIGFSAWARVGGTKLNDVNAAMPGTFISPQFLAMRPNSTGRDDVVIGAAHPTDQPRLDVYRITGVQTLTKRIFNADVT